MNPRGFFHRLLLPLILVAVTLPGAVSGQVSPFRIVSYNVWNGFGEKPEPRREQWRTWMSSRNPDVVALQEMNGFTPAQLEADAKHWGHPYSVLLKEDGFPTALTSRTPITELRRIRDGMHHGLLHGKIRGIHFYVIHFHPSHYARRIEEARLLVDDVRSLPDQDPRVVLIGDFNGFSPDDQAHYETDPKLVPFFEMLDQKYPEAKNLNAGRIDYGGIAEILNAGFVDLAVRSRPSTAPFAGTFPTELRGEEDLGTDRRIDYIFVSPNLANSAIYATVIRDPLTARLSDHYPLLAELEVPSN